MSEVIPTPEALAAITEIRNEKHARMFRGMSFLTPEEEALIIDKHVRPTTKAASQVNAPNP